jgi:acyl carrier protein
VADRRPPSTRTNPKDDTMPMLDSSTDIATWLAGQLASYLDIQPEQLDMDLPLAEYGLDSVYALNLCGEIEDSLGVAVEPTLAWDYPTVNAMAGYLRGELLNRAGNS